MTKVVTNKFSVTSKTSVIQFSITQKPFWMKTTLAHWDKYRNKYRGETAKGLVSLMSPNLSHTTLCSPQHCVTQVTDDTSKGYESNVNITTTTTTAHHIKLAFLLLRTLLLLIFNYQIMDLYI